MTEDDAARGLPTCPVTYLLRDGIPVCTTCGAVIGGADADQIRHSTWHTTLTALFAVADPHDPVDHGRVTFGPAPIAAGERGPVEQGRPDLASPRLRVRTRVQVSYDVRRRQARRRRLPLGHHTVMPLRVEYRDAAVVRLAREQGLG